jgi:hypothetical protein
VQTQEQQARMARCVVHQIPFIHLVDSDVALAARLLANMRKRTEALAARLDVIYEPGYETTVTFTTRRAISRVGMTADKPEPPRLNMRWQARQSAR